VSSLVRLPVYKYKYVLSLNNLINKGQLAVKSLEIIQYSLDFNKLLLLNVDIVPGVLELLNQHYSEKWISRIDENFYVYNFQQKPRLRQTPRASGKVTKEMYLPLKNYSGDVSGMIAESLFLYILKEAGIEENKIGHLRPLKRKLSYAPDFVIWDDKIFNNPKLRLNIECQLPVFAEVKGSTRGDLVKKLAWALVQLKNFINDAHCGLIFVARKNPNKTASQGFYEGILFEVKK
jgi:hypothetical protein